MSSIRGFAKGQFTPARAARFAERIFQTSQRAFPGHLHCMTPEKARRDRSGEWPAFCEECGFSFQSDVDLIDIARCAAPQYAPNESVNEFAERPMVKREWLRVQIRLAPVKRVFPDKTERIAEKAME